MSVTDHLPDAWQDLADDIRRARTTETVEVWQARATQAEVRVAKLEAVIAVAIAMLSDDRLRSAGAALRAALAGPAERPRPEPGTIMDDDQLEELAKAEDHGS
jgi:hypothetical protein